MTDFGPEFSENWSLHKPEAKSSGGAVASQNATAAAVGAAVLRDGGNAIDAAIATSFAVSVVEPWMSGLGGGGYMLVYLAKERRIRVIDFGMVAPRRLDPADYPLVEGEGAGDLFQWPAVHEDRNVYGYHSIAVPTQVAGMALAHKRFATKSWGDLITPAAELAAGGLPINWFATLRISAAAKELRQFGPSSEVYLEDGLAPTAVQGKTIPRRGMGNLSATLKRLAEAGARDFYEGALAETLVADAAAGGSRIAADDLAAVEALERDPLEMEYNGASVFAAPGLTAGPTMFDVLGIINGAITACDGSPTPESYKAYAAALKSAYDQRLETMGDADDTRDPACTTHLTTIDGDGNMVTLTQTLLSAFGSKVVFPSTGILMNNGIMWFDTRPDQPNSMAGGKRPLCNMCPTVVLREDGFDFALGASGGRRIMPAVMQNLSLMVDCKLSLPEAIHHPRIDVSGGETANVDTRLPREVVDAVSDILPVVSVEDSVFPSNFACPNGVADLIDTKVAQSYPKFPLSGAAGA